MTDELESGTRGVLGDRGIVVGGVEWYHADLGGDNGRLGGQSLPGVGG